jgi:RsmE family RNA methyltransferase
MNIVLFTRAELEQAVPSGDSRARHLREVLRRAVGEEFDLGVINGPRGKGRIAALPSDGSVHFTSVLGDEPPLLPPLQLLIGLPRPQTARKILQECTALGVESIHFVATGRADPNYAQSTLWSSGEWREHLVEGAQQAFCTRLPTVTCGQPLVAALAELPPATLRLALDNYEPTAGLADFALPNSTTAPSAVLALGPERGWAPADRAVLRAAGFTLVHLGPRVLRAETASVAAISILKARLGWLSM